MLEYVDGKTLDEFCGSRPISEKLALSIGRQIAEGLVAIHQRGLLHLDLKPSNIMLTRAGVVKIIDFGLSRRMDEVSFEEIAGSPGYLAPERSADTPNKIGAATDVFGLGAVIYRMLSCRSPFAGKTKSETVLNSVRGKLSVAKWGVWNVSARTKILVNCCLARSPEHRPQTAEAVLKKIKSNQRYLHLRWLGSIGIVAAFTILMLAWLFPDPLAATNSLYSSASSAQSNSSKAVAQGEKAQLSTGRSATEATSSVKEVLLDSAPTITFDRLHDLALHWSIRHLRFGEFAAAERVQLETAEAVKKHFPDAIAYQQSCEVNARIFGSLEALGFESKLKIGSAANLTCLAWQQHDIANFSGNKDATLNLKKAWEDSREILDEDHGWTILCHGEYLLARLKDLEQPLPAQHEFDLQVRRLQHLYGGASRLEAELNFAMMRRLLNDLVQQGVSHAEVAKFSDEKKDQDPVLQLILKHGRRSAMVASQYYKERHLRQAGITSLVGNFEFYWMNNQEQAGEYCRNVLQICDETASTNSICMVQTLLIESERKIRSLKYAAACKHLRKARHIAQLLVSETRENTAELGDHQTRLCWMYLSKCNEKLKQLRSVGSPALDLEERL